MNHNVNICGFRWSLGDPQGVTNYRLRTAALEASNGSALARVFGSMPVCGPPSLTCFFERILLTAHGGAEVRGGRGVVLLYFAWTLAMFCFGTVVT